VLLLVALTWSPLSAAAQPNVAADPAARLVRAALAANPRLEAIAARVEALRQEAIAAGAWANPQLGIALQNLPDNTFRLGEEPMSMLSLRLTQQIPVPGKSDRRRATKRAAALAEESALSEARNQLRAEVRRGFYQLALVRGLRRLSEERIAQLEELLQAVTAHYATGGGAQQDLLRLQVELQRLEDQLHDFDQRKRVLQAALNAARQLPPDTAIATPRKLPLPLPPVKGVDRLLQIALEERPALEQLRRLAAQQEASAALARAETFADPTLFLQYGLRRESASGSSGRDLVSLGISWPLPLFRATRNQAPAAAADARANASLAEASALRDRIAADLESQIATWQRALEQSRSYRSELIPGARRLLQTALGDYRVGRTDFQSLFQAEMQLIDFEETLFRTAITALIARAEVERLIGTELS
jgi:outer membrane protein TolC